MKKNCSIERSPVITIADVSRVANVSMSTVSHVINGTKNVSEETRRRVMAAIEATGYTQNFIAKALKKSETKTIGLVISDIRNRYFIDVIYAINNEAAKHGYTVLLASSDDNSKTELEIIKTFHERRVDGIILSPTTDSENNSVPFINKMGIPVVYVDRMPAANGDWVGTENEKATEALANHLISLGHKRIALVVGLRGINTTEERITGYKNALGNAGIPFDPHFIVPGESRSEPSKTKTKEMISQMMSAGSCPTAIIAANNLMVLGTMRALQELGLRVPEDIALVAFDDFEWADLFQPRLTTIVQPCYDIGSKAVEMLIRRIHDPDATVQKTCFTPKLVVRESCGIKLKHGG